MVMLKKQCLKNSKKKKGCCTKKDVDQNSNSLAKIFSDKNY